MVVVAHASLREASLAEIHLAMKSRLNAVYGATQGDLRVVELHDSIQLSRADHEAGPSLMQMGQEFEEVALGIRNVHRFESTVSNPFDGVDRTDPTQRLTSCIP